jgi:hypothetical protein
VNLLEKTERFYVDGLRVIDRTLEKVTAAFTDPALAEFYKDTLNRLWLEGRIKSV